MIHPDDLKKVENKINETIFNKNSLEFNLEFRTKSIHGKVKWLKAKGRVYTNEQDVAIRFIGTILDNTAQKIIDDTTKELLSKKDEFISIASHELKTPITALKASLQLLRRMKDKPYEMTNVLVEQANKSMDRVTTLIENLLNANKITEGQLNLNKTSFCLAKMIEDCCQHVRIDGIYSIITDGDTELTVYADCDRIDQVVVNFINNAIKYAPESKEIHVLIEKIDNQAKISIHDNGPGIPEDKIPYLFDRYFRADSGGMQFSGLGLGLYISAQIIKRHNGQIGVESETGKGSTFWFTLPLSNQSEKN